jgi:hypothetical protein
MVLATARGDFVRPDPAGRTNGRDLIDSRHEAAVIVADLTDDLFPALWCTIGTWHDGIEFFS